MSVPTRRAALAVAVLTTVTFVVAFATPPLSGPFCTADCVAYPFTDVASRFPRDYVWMVLAIPQIGSYLVLLALLHEEAPPGARAWSRLALLFGAMGAAVLIVTYYVQLAVVQPSLLRGESDGIALLSQYNPHGLFIGQEEIGYLLVAVSFGLLAPAVPGAAGSARSLPWLLRLGSLGAAVAAAWFFGTLGHDREYLLEVALICIDWLVLIAASVLIAIRAGKPAG